jgi:transcriptional regulator with XRE-family HTH domain
MSLADNLKNLITRNHLSMTDVARLSENSADSRGRINQGYISRLESGQEDNPSLMKMMTLCRIYKAKPADLLVNSRKEKKKNK